MKKTLFIVAILAFAFTGCSEYKMNAVAKKASFDFNCPKKDVKVIELERSTFGAVGCGKRASYQTYGHCDGFGRCRIESDKVQVEIQ